jgi:hypothetical protein
MKKIIVVLVSMLPMLIAQGQTRTLPAQPQDTSYKGLRSEIIKERTVINDTAYLHIKIKIFHNNPKDVTVVYTQNWNFCFYTGDSFIDSLNYRNNTIYYFSQLGSFKEPENFIFLTGPKDLVRYARESRGPYAVGLGNLHELCISSHFRKLCGSDTLQVDFWLSDPTLIIYCTTRKLITIPVIYQLPKTFFPKKDWKWIPRYRKKDLYIKIKNPPPLFIKEKGEMSIYYGHKYEQAAKPLNCKKKYRVHSTEIDR